MVKQMRPGANSSRLCVSAANSKGWRTFGLEVAGYSRKRLVLWAARARAM
jgi:hypothetical protein